MYLEAELSLLSPCWPGNHETDNMNQIYGFEGEVKAKYTAQMYELFSEVFEWLPLAQCINGKVLVRTARAPSVGSPPSHTWADMLVKEVGACGWVAPSLTAASPISPDHARRPVQ